MPTSPTQRSLKLLRDDGYLVDVCERWIAQARKRKDLFGILDLCAVRGKEIVGVQVTSGSNVAARIKKITEHPSTPVLREAGVTLLVHGWRRNSKGRWVCRTVDVS